MKRGHSKAARKPFSILLFQPRKSQMRFSYWAFLQIALIHKTPLFFLRQKITIFIKPSLSFLRFILQIFVQNIFNKLKLHMNQSYQKYNHISTFVVTLLHFCFINYHIAPLILLLCILAVNTLYHYYIVSSKSRYVLSLLFIAVYFIIMIYTPKNNIL